MVSLLRRRLRRLHAQPRRPQRLGGSPRGARSTRYCSLVYYYDDYLHAPLPWLPMQQGIFITLSRLASNFTTPPLHVQLELIAARNDIWKCKYLCCLLAFDPFSYSWSG